MRNIDIIKAGDCLPELIAQSIDGNDVIITRAGQPVVKLVPITGQKRKRHFGSAKGLIKISKDFDEPLEDFKDYM